MRNAAHACAGSDSAHHACSNLRQDASNPDFVAEVVELYFEDSAGKVDKLEQKLSAPVPDFNEVDQLVHQFKGSSASFGAQAIAALCVQARRPLMLFVPMHRNCLYIPPVLQPTH